MKTRNNIYENIFSARALFISGLIMMPALLFNPSTEYRFFQFLFFWLLLLLSGKKTNPFLTVVTIFFITAFNLIIPYGKVLFAAGPVKITSGALKTGIHRAVTFMGLIMLSKVSIRQDLKIPGFFGELLGESLRLFSVMMSKRYSLKRKNLIKTIDNLLIELSVEDFSGNTEDLQNTKTAGYIILAAAICVSWSPWLKIVPVLDYFNF
jgi:heptaprenyl diphosphate synthase